MRAKKWNNFITTINENEARVSLSGFYSGYSQGRNRNTQQAKQGHAFYINIYKV